MKSVFSSISPSEQAPIYLQRISLSVYRWKGFAFNCVLFNYTFVSAVKGLAYLCIRAYWKSAWIREPRVAWQSCVSDLDWFVTRLERASFALKRGNGLRVGKVGRCYLLPATTASSIFLPRFVTFISFPCFSIANASVFGFDKSRAAKTILPRPFSSLRFPP